MDTPELKAMPQFLRDFASELECALLLLVPVREIRAEPQTTRPNSLSNPRIPRPSNFANSAKPLMAEFATPKASAKAARAAAVT